MFGRGRFLLTGGELLLPLLTLGIWPSPASVLVAGTKHHLFAASTDGSPAIYAFEFDDAAKTVQLVANSSAHTTHPWITFDYNKQNIYAANGGLRSFSSYSIGTQYALKHDSEVPMSGNCSETSATHVLASPNWPHVVYGTGYPGPASCGTVMSVEWTGRLKEEVQAYSYSLESGISSLAFSPNAYFLYSADLSGDAIWSHTASPQTGQLEFTFRQVLSDEKASGPRGIVAHEMGRTLFVLADTMQLLLYNLGPTTGLPEYNMTLSILPQDADKSDYQPASIALSPSGSFLWVILEPQSSRGQGYLIAFALDPVTGDLLGKLFEIKTRAIRAGTGAAFSPSFFSDEFVALPNPAADTLEIWQLNPGTGGANGATLATATAYAHMNGTVKGCCGNVIWYD